MYYYTEGLRRHRQRAEGRAAAAESLALGDARIYYNIQLIQTNC